MSLRPEDAVGSSHRKRDAASWAAVAKQYRRASGDNSDESLYTLAVNRLANGDVKDTGYGLRVECRDDLGDDRIAAAAYWPDNRACLCRSMKTRKCCSHDLAARIFKFADE
jgi:hypothetical protein